MERLAGKVILLWGWRRAAVAFGSGALAVLAQAPFDFFAACLISFPILVWLLDGAVAAQPAGFLRRLRPAFATGWWFGFGYFTAGLWWIGNALLVEADSFAWALPLAVLALPAALAIFYGLAAALAKLAWSDGIGRIAALAAGFGIAEWLRAVMFTGFPWNAIGYAAMPVPLLMQSVSLTGLYGMNALAVFVFAMPALLASQRHRRTGMALALLMVVAHVGYGILRLRAEPTAERSIAVRIVQPSIDQAEKWDVAVRDRIFKTYLDYTALPPSPGHGRPQLIVWPETAMPFLTSERPDALAALGALLEDGQVLLAGAVRAEGNRDSPGVERFYNSIIAVDTRGEIVNAFDKAHLVPFGEYLPLEPLLGRIGLTKIVATPMSFSAGAGRRAMQLPEKLTVLPLICYEIIFPGEVAGTAAESDVIVNVTNDAWYGDTPGPYQHFRQAQVRAVELGLPLVRAANNGISAVVRADGRIIDAFALNATGVIDVDLPLERRAQAPWSSFVNALGILAFFAILACAMTFSRRHRPN
ncbi:MAG: apolipoprotein N-acyltransferase [Mesorhizobium sp.]|nr:apolipoprotein N-acyltransferase [Mesorhizobium sp.]